MHEYGYFEINRVPWFFRSAISIVFKNAISNNFGIFFQHAQGGDLTSNGVWTGPGPGIPTIRYTCYGPPRFSIGSPIPTEEDSNSALLTPSYLSITGDPTLLTDDITRKMSLIDARMQHTN